jgi:hypothetical protein
MSDNIKTLYTFSVEDKAATETSPATKRYFAFKKPSRAEREDAEMEYAACVNKCLERGLMPQALLIKQYANAGGTMNDSEKGEFNVIRNQLLTKEGELAKALIGTDLALREQLTAELLDIREQYVRFQQSQETFFSNTAEAKARNKLIEWYVINMAYHRSDETKPWEVFFIGDKIEDKLIYLDKLEENEDALYLKSKDQLAFVAALYVSMGGNLKKEDIDAFFNLPADPKALVNAAIPTKTESQPSA